MAYFDERSGIVVCDTAWGNWYQMIDEVVIQVNIKPGTRGREIKCDIKPRFLKVVIQGETVIEGDLHGLVQPGDSIWTLEDNKVLRILLMKADKTAGNVWSSLMKGQYRADAVTLDEMHKKLTLQKIQMGNEGMDFSAAEITGNYRHGGPELAS